MQARPVTNIKFVHCRNINKDGTINPNGGLTIAYNINSEFKVVGWAAAKCHTNDNYNKKLGRMKASGRLLSNKYYNTCEEMEETKFIQQTQEGYQREFSEQTNG